MVIKLRLSPAKRAIHIKEHEFSRSKYSIRVRKNWSIAYVNWRFGHVKINNLHISIRWFAARWERVNKCPSVSNFGFFGISNRPNWWVLDVEQTKVALRFESTQPFSNFHTRSKSVRISWKEKSFHTCATVFLVLLFNFKEKRIKLELKIVRPSIIDYSLESWTFPSRFWAILPQFVVSSSKLINSNLGSTLKPD